MRSRAYHSGTIISASKAHRWTGNTYSFGNLKKEIENNLEEMKRRGREEYLRELAEQQAIQEIEEKAKLEAQRKQEEQLGQQTEEQAKKQQKMPAIGGVELTPEQWQTLKNGGYIFLENMNKKDGSGTFSSYVFLNDEKNKAFFSNKNPDEFVRYGKYEMRIRNKRLIEAGYVTKAKVKWYGYGNYANPYLWKENIADAEYKESWSDPRISKEEKPQNTQQQKPKETKLKVPKVQEKKRGRGI